MKRPKLSVPSHVLLHFIAERGGMSSTTRMEAIHWSQKPDMSNMRGLVKRGWVEEKNHIFRITEEGLAAAKLLGVPPPVEPKYQFT